MDSNPTLPSIRSAMALQMARPNPVPLANVLSLAKRWNNLGLSSSDMPMPVSRVYRRIPPSSKEIPMVTSPSAVYFQRIGHKVAEYLRDSVSVTLDDQGPAYSVFFMQTDFGIGLILLERQIQLLKEL